MNSFAVVRADDMSKVRTTLCDLIRYAHLSFEGKARRLEPAFADNILIHVMKSPLRMCCEAASIVPLNEDASAAIGRLRKIHPPGHVIIVSPRHEIYHELVNFVDILPEIELDMEWSMNPIIQTSDFMKVNNCNREIFDKCKDDAANKWAERSARTWTQDFGDYIELYKDKNQADIIDSWG